MGAYKNYTIPKLVLYEIVCINQQMHKIIYNSSCKI